MISMIVAMSADRAIGYRGGLPWHIPADLTNFKRLTTGNIVVMGRTTFESLPMKGGLPNRVNIVLTRGEHPESTNMVRYVSSLDFDQLREIAALSNREVFIIGGANVYAQAFPYVDRVYLSLVKGCAVGDTYFPDVDWFDFRKQHDEDCGDYVYRIMDRVR